MAQRKKVEMADIHVKVDARVKAKTEWILGEIGISMSDLINMTLRRVVAERRIPFETGVRREMAPPDLVVRTREEVVEKLEEALRHREEHPDELYTEKEVREWIGM